MANDVDNGSLSFEALAVDDIKRWADVMPLVEEAVAALRTAQSGEEIATATQVLHMATARARDYESAAINTMKTYGYSDGVKPESTDGRREDTGRGVRKLQTRWSGLEFGKMRGWRRSAGVWGGADGGLQWLW